MSQSNLRTFSIIAHIDHGKSTLADRILELTHTLSKREMREQVLDSMDLERERGITIKLQAVRVSYEARDGQLYTLQLIDTPGHVDFSYEVSRALAACDGAILVVDAGQGVEAQTLANVYLALEHNLEIIPVINKIDLPTADPERCLRQIRDLIGLDTEGALLVSGKTGQGVPELLEAIVERVPSPRGDPDAPLRALIFDSAYDSYKGVITYIRVRDGSIRRGDKIRFMATGDEFEVSELGYFIPRMVPTEILACGEVGYLAAVVKTIASVKVGDTVTHARRRAEKPLPGYKVVKPVVFAGLYPIISDDFDELRDAIEKLKLNDASFHSEPETSNALGFGFRCGFLGLLHMEIVQERLEREFNLELVTTAPSVGYRVILTNGEAIEMDNPSKLPTADRIERMEEPYIEARVIVPTQYVGSVMKLMQEKKGSQKNMQYPDETRIFLTYDLPLSEVLFDFYDKLKSYTQGYASFDYDLIGYRPGKLVKLDILINGEPVDALSIIVHREDAYRRGRSLAERLRKIVPRQLYEVVIQAAIGGKILARETVKAIRKDVTAKCYGGDITRKRKLLEKQKEGKKRMKQIGRVELPQEAFLAVLKMED